MSLFTLDTTGDKSLLQCKSAEDLPGRSTTRIPNYIPSNKHVVEKVENRLDLQSSSAVDDDDDDDDDSDFDYFGIPPPSEDLSDLLNELVQPPVESELSKRLENVSKQFDDMFINKKSKTRRLEGLTDFTLADAKALAKADVAKEMSKTRIVPNIEQLKELPSLTKKERTKQNRLERAKSKGPSWFNLPATEADEDVTNQLKILQMRSVLDPKHFYKKNDLKVLPKYFQVGTVEHSPLDHYSERNTRKNKRTSLVDEVMQDEIAQNYTKRKYKEVMSKREKYQKRKATQKMKKLKKNKN